jgi:hypothetical protein
MGVGAEPSLLDRHLAAIIVVVILGINLGIGLFKIERTPCIVLQAFNV